MLRRLAAVMLLPLVVSATAAAALAASTVALAPVVTQSVSGAQIAAVTDKLADGLVHDADRSVVPAFRLSDQAVPLGKVELTPLAPLVYPTYIAVPVQITVDGRLARTVTSGYRVQSFIHTAVAARDLAPGTLLGPDDLTLARVLSNGRPAVAVAALVGRKIRAATSRGQQIFVEQTAVNELVKAGAGAILVVHDGPVALTADVIARTGGGLGESVTVYNAQTNRLLSGVVTGPDRVEITLPGGEQSDD
ncbi:MAG: flagellar basal body P-ring formation chaperone FlgA [Candidatus Lustribacter sp.]|jgi:flagella basal body P-ring formation protein FlgA